MPTRAGSQIAYFYGRVSTVAQSGEKHSSLDVQQARAEAFCTARGYNLVSTFIDVQSGRRNDRAEYRRMVDLAKQGGADLIVVQFLDRFGRNPREILSRIWELKDHDIEVVATDEDIQEELSLFIRTVLAGAESRRTSERVRSYMSSRAAKGVHFGRAPYGYRRTRINDNVLWEQEPREAAAIREMFRLATEENVGNKSIADRVNAMGYRSRTGRPFAAFTIQHILTNPSITGIMEYGRQPKPGNPQPQLVRIDDFFPAILSKLEWEQLQERQQIRRTMPPGPTHKSSYLLSGIARCGHCGGPMVGKRTSTYKGRKYAKYYCSRAQTSRDRCAFYNGHTASTLENAVLEYLGHYSNPNKVRELLAAAGRRELKRKENELLRVERRLVEIESDFSKNLDLLKREVINEAEFRRANEASRKERNLLAERQQDLTAWLANQVERQEAVAALPSRVRSFLGDFLALDTRRAKAALQSLIASAYIYRDARIELEFRS